MNGRETVYTNGDLMRVVTDAINGAGNRAIDLYVQRFDAELYQRATDGARTARANELIDTAMALCGHPRYKVEPWNWTGAELAFLSRFLPEPPVLGALCEVCGDPVEPPSFTRYALDVVRDPSDERPWCVVIRGWVFGEGWRQIGGWHYYHKANAEDKKRRLIAAWDAGGLAEMLGGLPIETPGKCEACRRAAAWDFPPPPPEIINLDSSLFGALGLVPDEDGRASLAVCFLVWVLGLLGLAFVALGLVRLGLGALVIGALQGVI